MKDPKNYSDAWLVRAREFANQWTGTTVPGFAMLDFADYVKDGKLAEGANEMLVELLAAAMATAYRESRLPMGAEAT